MPQTKGASFVGLVGLCGLLLAKHCREQAPPKAQEAWSFNHKFRQQLLDRIATLGAQPLENHRVTSNLAEWAVQVSFNTSKHIKGLIRHHTMAPLESALPAWPRAFYGELPIFAGTQKPGSEHEYDTSLDTSCAAALCTMVE
ncbi:MYND domain protein [Aspergillus luchuensis]|uniref:MYND domain protein n=1 Tax=Aspergillus kawachii TaxID=1069201 RepID=A0A146FNQ7_ASPKA|nr:MYND domain protein [Aspergillus luchuensis]